MKQKRNIRIDTLQMMIPLVLRPSENSAQRKKFDEPTSQQLESLRWIVEKIATEYNLNIDNDVYSHGAIARKQPSEGIQLRERLSSGGS